ncbi:MAG TPA: response regulator [bacterium]|jgi:CheY-like chemotaxis protein|nr:response regulator [bacterium]
MANAVLAVSKEVLVVEDTAIDLRMILAALNAGANRKTITAVTDGEQALAHLNLQAHGAKPDLILLDLNLPRIDGWQVLGACKTDPALKAIPVVVFTTSLADSDVKRCYALGANSFVTKPYDMDAFQGAVEMIERYWLGLSAPWIRS